MTRTVLWMSLCAVGLTAGVASALVLGDPLSRVVGMMLVTPLLTGLVGSMLGAAQLLSLRRVIRVPMVKWLAATTFGLGAGLALGVVIVEQTGILVSGTRPHVLQLTPALRALSLAVVGASSGLLLGLTQRFVLRPVLPTLRRWVLSSALALSGGFGAASLLVDSLIQRGIASPLGLLAFLLVAGALYGLITAVPLRRAA